MTVIGSPIFRLIAWQMISLSALCIRAISLCRHHDATFLRTCPMRSCVPAAPGSRRCAALCHAWHIGHAARRDTARRNPVPVRGFRAGREQPARYLEWIPRARRAGRATWFGSTMLRLRGFAVSLILPAPWRVGG
jgi:hypothetical protein